MMSDNANKSVCIMFEGGSEQVAYNSVIQGKILHIKWRAGLSALKIATNGKRISPFSNFE